MTKRCRWFDCGLENLGIVVQRSAEVRRYERRLRTDLLILLPAEPRLYSRPDALALRVGRLE